MKTVIALEMRKMSHRGRRMQIFNLLSKEYKIIYIAPMQNILYRIKANRSDWRGIFSFKYKDINENFIYVEMPTVFMPFHNVFRLINKLNNFILSRVVKRIQKHTNSHKVDIWWVGYPFAVDYVLSKDKVVYDCFDDHLGWKGFYSRKVVGRIEKDLLGKADLALFSSSELVRKKSMYANHSKLVMNGADYDHFYLPPERSLNRSNIVLYIGVVSDWCDIALLEYLAIELKSYQFWYVGPVRKDYLGNIKNLPNVKLFGLQPYESLMDYMKEAAVCTIPFDPTHKVIKSTNPIKMYEYFAAGKPVLSTGIEEVKKYQEDVYIANNPEEFARLIPLAIEENSVEKITSRQRIARENTWSKRVRDIAKELEKI